MGMFSQEGIPVFVISSVFLLALPGNCVSVVKKCETSNTCHKYSLESIDDGTNLSRNMSVLAFSKRTDLVSKKCKMWKSYWNCQKVSQEERLVVEFAEDFPDWTKEYWILRSKCIPQMTLKLDYHATESVLVDASFPLNTSGSGDIERIKFKTKFLTELEKEFCFEAFDTYGEEIDVSQEIRNNTAFSCTYVKAKPKKAIQDLYIGLLFIASVFLLLTCIVYLIIWDNQNLNGWAIFSEVLSNFFMILTVGLSHYYVRDLDVGPASPGCIILAVTSHFFFLSTFHWMTVINYNLWKTFRQLRNPDRNSNKVVTYFCYAAFAIGVPLVIVILCFLVDHFHSRFSTDSIDKPDQTRNLKNFFMRPHYGKKFCYMSKEAQGHYIYYPIGTLIVTNAILFGMTAYSLLQHRKATKVLQGGRNVSTRRHGRCDNQTTSQVAGPTQSIVLFAKLFSVMGVSWVFEVFAWAFSTPGENVPLYWIIFDVTNLVQAIAVFIIFVCKREVLVSVWKKLCNNSSG